MKRTKLLCALLAAVMLAACLIPAVTAAAELAEANAGAAEFPITPYAGDGVTLEYDENAFSLRVTEQYGLCRVTESRELTLTARFGDGWTYSASYSNFFRNYADRVTSVNNSDGSITFTFSIYIINI